MENFASFFLLQSMNFGQPKWISSILLKIDIHGDPNAYIYKARTYL